MINFARLKENRNMQWLLVCIIVAIPIWAHLTELPIQLWDESRVAINSFEMYKDHHFLTTHFNGEPDMWNTKPPFVVWAQFVSYHVFGINEFAVRFPSALAGTLTCLFLFWFLARKKKNPVLGIISVVILITSYGFVKYHHSPRTGDYDAMLTFFSLAYIIFFYLFIEEEKSKYLYLAMLCITLTVMVKSVTGLIFVPALFLYTLYKKKLLLVLKSPALYLGIIFFILIVGGYYWIREQHNPGYWEAVQINDLWGRMNIKHEDSGRYVPVPFYYYNLIIDSNYRYWYFFLPIGALVGIYHKQDLKDITIFCFLLCLVFFLVISSSKTKHDWYDMPMMPLFAVLSGIGVYTLAHLLANSVIWQGVLNKNVLPYIFIVLPALPAYAIMLVNSTKPDPGEWISYNTHVCKYLKDMYYSNLKVPDISLVDENEYQANVDWYAQVLKEKKNANVAWVKYENINPYSKIVVYKDGTMKRIEQDFQYSYVEKIYDDKIRIYQLNGKNN